MGEKITQEQKDFVMSRLNSPVYRDVFEFILNTPSGVTCDDIRMNFGTGEGRKIASEISKHYYLPRIYEPHINRYGNHGRHARYFAPQYYKTKEK